jgi:hypothetical protein
MLYQWGRKDPFPTFLGATFAMTYPENPMETMEKGTYMQTLTNPRTSFVGTDWNSDNNLWNSDKTIYDPCPSGWRVPDGNPGVWSDISSYGWNGWNGFAYISTAGLNVNYPTAGYTDSRYNSNFFGEYAYCYSCSTDPHGLYAFYFRVGQYNYETYSSINRDSHLSVRCQRMDISDKEGDGDDYEVDDDYIWD